MPIPEVTCSPQKQVLEYSDDPQNVTAHASATNDPYLWTWVMLDVPPGGEAAKNSGDFVNGVASGPDLTDPEFTTVGGIYGSYVLQAVAINDSGPSDPTKDKERGQCTVVVKSKYRGLRLPGSGEYDWKPSLDSTLRNLDGPLSEKGDLVTFSTTVTRLPVGNSGQILSADPSSETGIKWIDQPHSDANKVFSTPLSYTGTLAVGDAVCLITSAADTVCRASSADYATAEVLGFVYQKDYPEDGKCVVQIAGEVSGISPVGTPPFNGKRVFLSLDGAVSDTPPSTGVVKPVGIMRSSSVLCIRLEPAIVL